LTRGMLVSSDAFLFGCRRTGSYATQPKADA
jgi:hypothetical protein